MLGALSTPGHGPQGHESGAERWSIGRMNVTVGRINRDDQRERFGSNYFCDGKLQYRGYFHQGVPSGFGVEYFPNGQPSFQGYFVEGRRQGNGTAFFTQGV